MPARSRTRSTTTTTSGRDAVQSLSHPEVDGAAGRRFARPSCRRRAASALNRPANCHDITRTALPHTKQVLALTQALPGVCSRRSWRPHDRRTRPHPSSCGLPRGGSRGVDAVTITAATIGRLMVMPAHRTLIARGTYRAAAIYSAALTVTDRAVQARESVRSQSSQVQE